MIRVNILTPVVLFLLAGMFYVFPSGNPQPADALYVVTVLAVLIMFVRRYPLTMPEVATTGVLLGYVILINATYLTNVGDPAFFRSSVFYVYNLFVFITVTILLRNARVGDLKAVAYAAMISLLIEIVMITIAPDYLGRRQKGTFNNPNQLAYWAMLAAMIYFLAFHYCERHAVYFRFARLQHCFVLLATFYIVGLSLSKAAIAGMVVFLALILKPMLKINVAIFFYLLLLLGFILLIATPGVETIAALADRTGSDFLARIAARLADVQSDESLQSRGYFRVFSDPVYLFIGAGEGADWRLSDNGKALEVHSTVFQFITAYGLVGSVFMVMFLFAFVRGFDALMVATMVGLLIYGLAHNGLRFTHFWIYFALFAHLSQHLVRRAPVPPMMPGGGMVMNQQYRGSGVNVR